MYVRQTRCGIKCYIILTVAEVMFSPFARRCRQLYCDNYNDLQRVLVKL